jgi:hypothetical protein
VSEFKHGPHCVPQEDHARLMELLNRLRASNLVLATENQQLRQQIALLQGRMV